MDFDNGFNTHAGPSVPPDEALLIERLRRGDMRSYEVLFARYYPVFLALCRGMVKDSTLAQDICQNVFMKVWIHRERLDPLQSIRNYLYVLCKREIIDYFRISRTDMFIALEQMTLHNIPQAEQASSLSMHLLRTRVRQVYSQLPDKRRQVFFLSRFKHWSNQEIARHLGISVRTVEKHIQLALKTFRKALGDTSDYIPLLSIIILMDNFVTFRQLF